MKEITEKLSNNYIEIQNKQNEVFELERDNDNLLHELYLSIKEEVNNYQTKYKELRGLRSISKNEYGIDFLFKNDMLPFADGLKIIEEETGLKFIGTAKNSALYTFHAIKE